jgi:CubicO group peptidase (beta-lactamase class C family)
MLRRACLFLLPACAWAQLAPEKIEKIEQFTAEQMSADSIPAVSVAVAVNGQMQWQQGFGFQDLENHIPARATTMYRLGSISKPITAVAALQLWERGKLDLDAPVQKYVPGFPEKPEGRVTVRLLLAHLGGVRHYREGEIDSIRTFDDVLAPLEIFKNDPLEAAPGTKYIYTTYGYNLVGAAVEAAAGKRFLEFVRESVFQPAGMDRIRDDSRWAVIPNRARGYSKRTDGVVVNTGFADTSNKVPGGGMIGTVGDLIKFALAVRDGRLLRRETLDLMWAKQRLKNGKESSYGLGWNVEPNGRGLIVNHSGGQQGCSTMLMLNVRTGNAVAVMANMDGVGAGPLARRILAMLDE